MSLYFKIVLQKHLDKFILKHDFLLEFKLILRYDFVMTTVYTLFCFSLLSQLVN